MKQVADVSTGGGFETILHGIPIGSDTCLDSRHKQIILGGGGMGQKHLFPLIREEATTLLKGYIQHLASLRILTASSFPPDWATVPDHWR